MPQIKKFLILLLVYLFLGKFTTIQATEIFSDTFSGGYSNSWQITPNSLSPIPSTHGIAASSNSQWSDILLPLNENSTYNAQFDLWVNSDDVNSAWRLYIINSSFNNYKIINNWGPNNLLQVSEFNGVDVLNQWNHNTGNHHFEIIVSPLANTDIIVIEDGIEKARIASTADFDIAYINIGLLGLGDYEISNFVLSTNSPSPTSTPTPTPSPTLTPSPSPTSVPTNKVVVIPGMGGSWSSDLLTCGLTNTGAWVSMPKYGDVYQNLIDEIAHRGFTPIPYYYDWRRNIPDHATGLSSFIASNTQPAEKIDIVGHSMGGLVARGYVDYEGSLGNVDKLITVGTPHRGSALAYPALSGGENWINDPAVKFAFAFITNWCGNSLMGISDREAIQTLLPSAYNTLPLDSYLKDQKTKLFKNLNTLNLQNNWLSSSPFSYPFFGITVGTLSGIGRQTLQNIEVKEPNKIDAQNGNWLDGKPTQKENSTNGDGMVLLSSSTIPGANNLPPLNQDHGGIVSSQDGITSILSFLGINGVNSAQNEELKSDSIKSSLAIIADSAWFWITDPDGNTVNDTQGLAVVTNPKKGSYRLMLIPKTLGSTRIAIAQFPDNGKILWKEYKHLGLMPKFSTFILDPNSPQEDIIQ